MLQAQRESVRAVAADQRDAESRSKQQSVQAAMEQLYSELVEANQLAAESERNEAHRAHE